MKKFFTLCLALLTLSVVPAMAQDDDEDELDNTFQFYHAEVNGTDTTWTVVPDGSVYTTNNIEEDLFSGGVQILSGLYVRNTSDENAPARVHMTIDDLPTGQIQFCMLGQCQMYSTVGQDNAKGGIITAGHNDDMMLEWLPDNYGTATITLQANPAMSTSIGFNPTYDDAGVGPKITVKFEYADPTGISSVESNEASSKVSAIYNLRGEQLSQMQKGLNIVRYADGTAKKVIK